MKGGYAFCMNEWALDKEIKNEIRLLIIISSLTAKEGYCYASNKYFSELFDEDESTISRKIRKLQDKNYITIEYDKRGCEIVSRKIRLTKISIDDCQKYQSTIDENVKENNTSINNTSINITTTTDTIFDFLEKNGFVLTPIHYEIIQEWEDNDLTRYAIKQAVASNKYNIKYIQQILNSYEKENIKTVQQAIEREEQFNNRKNYKKESDVPKWFNQDLGKGNFLDDEEPF